MPSATEPPNFWTRLVRALKRFFGGRGGLEADATARSAIPAVPSQELRVGEERRAHVRVAVELRVAVRFDTIEDVLRSHTVDLSEAGVFIATTSPRAVGTRVRIAMTVGEQAVDLPGEVVRCLPPAKASGAMPGMGVRFEALSDEAQALVDEICARR